SELADTMAGIHDRCEEAAERHGAPGDYVLGSNVAGFERVAEAMLAQGLICPCPSHFSQGPWPPPPQVGSSSHAIPSPQVMDLGADEVVVDLTDLGVRFLAQRL